MLALKWTKSRTLGPKVGKKEIIGYNKDTAPKNLDIKLVYKRDVTKNILDQFYNKIRDNHNIIQHNEVLDISSKIWHFINLPLFTKFKHQKPKNLAQIEKLNEFVRLKTRSLSVISQKK